MTSLRGLGDAKTIDLVTEDVRTRECVLIISAAGWEGSDEQLSRLQEKLNAYLTFALDGELLRRFPAAADKKIRIQIDFDRAPSGLTADFLVQASKEISRLGMHLAANVLE